MGARPRWQKGWSAVSIAERIEKIFEECGGGLWGTSGVSSWEHDRLDEWRGRNNLSPRQVAVLESIEVKVFGRAQD